MKIQNLQYVVRLSCTAEANKNLHFGVLDIGGHAAKVALVHLIKPCVLRTLPLHSSKPSTFSTEVYYKSVGYSEYNFLSFSMNFEINDY